MEDDVKKVKKVSGQRVYFGCCSLVARNANSLDGPIR